MARLSPIDSRSRGSRARRIRKAPALVAVVALLLAGVLALMGGSGRSGAVQTSPSSATATTATSDDGSVSVLEAATRVDTPFVLEIADAARQEAAAPAASQAVASAAAEAPVGANASLSPVDRWAAQGIDLVMQGEEWDDLSLANVDQALSALPPGLLTSLGNPALGEMQIVVNREGRELSGTQPYGGPANFYSTNDGVNELVLYPHQSAFTVLHELGHAYNLRRTPAGRYALVLLDPEMQSFMAATGWQVLATDDQVRAAVDQIGVSYSYSGGFMWSNLSHFDPLEDFANSFAMYFLDSATLNSLSPARYDWFAANIGR